MEGRTRTGGPRRMGPGAPGAMRGEKIKKVLGESSFSTVKNIGFLLLLPLSVQPEVLFLLWQDRINCLR